ncbi:MAG: PAS domain S-box protein, partial [Vicinamibacteria bacterium]|nr:PAS domain S-box protein [Vicinamibacteria bacterium]
ESLLDHAEVGVYSVSVDLKQVLAINPAMEAIFGHSKADFARNPRLWLDLIDPRDLPFIGDPLRDLRMGGKSRHMYRIRRPDGAILWVLDQSHRVDDEQGRPERFDCLFTDITRRRLAEEAFAASEARFRLLAEHAKDVISRHAPDATFLYVSPACRALLGYSAARRPATSRSCWCGSPPKTDARRGPRSPCAPASIQSATRCARSISFRAM